MDDSDLRKSRKYKSKEHNMLSFASIPVQNKVLYVPIESAILFKNAQLCVWDHDKKDVILENEDSFCHRANTFPVLETPTCVYFDGIDHPHALRMQDLELNRQY